MNWNIQIYNEIHFHVDGFVDDGIYDEWIDELHPQSVSCPETEGMNDHQVLVHISTECTWLGHHVIEVVDEGRE